MTKKGLSCVSLLSTLNTLFLPFFIDAVSFAGLSIDDLCLDGFSFVVSHGF